MLASAQTVRGAGSRLDAGQSAPPDGRGFPMTTTRTVNNDDISGLIETLRETDRRLEELTAGEVDAVTDHDGRAFLLRHAQGSLRESEASRQAAILDALPAHIALLDAQGGIVSVNEAWRRFAGGNVLQDPGYGIGINYLDVCDSARGDDASSASQAAAGIRAVLEGSAPGFSIEYPCHSPGEQRWFLLTVTPLDREQPGGAVVMHRDITERVQREESLRRFSAAMDATVDAIYVVDRDSMRFVHVNETACRMRQQTREELFALGPHGLLATSREALARIYDALIAGGRDSDPVEMLQQRKDGTQAWVELRRHAQRIGDRWTIVTLVRDVTERKRAIETLRESESRFRSLTMLSSDWFWEQDSEHRFVAFSGGESVDGWGPDQQKAVGMRRWELPDIVPLDGDWSAHKALLDAHQPFRDFEYRRILGNGALQYVAASGEPLFDADGLFTGYRGVASDITGRKEAEKRIVNLSRVHAVLSGINTLIVRVRERDELFAEACSTAVKAGGFRLAWIGIVDAAASGLTICAVAGANENIEAVFREQFASNAAHAGSLRGRTPGATAIRERAVFVANDSQNDPRVPFTGMHVSIGIHSMTVLPLIVGDTAVGVLGLYAAEKGFFDEAEMKLLAELADDIAFAIDHIGKRERLDYLSYYDPLTGLANRSLFLERVAQYVRSAAAAGHKAAVFMVDLERFRNINDSLGRPAGDTLLRQVAEWLVLNAGDAGLVARVGADHFALVLPEVKRDGGVARLLDKSLAAVMAHPFRLDNDVYRIAVKAGVALYPDDGADADTLLRNAEAALKKAKAAGERSLFYAQEMTASVAGNLSMENQLRLALEREEFVLHYQPKVNAVTGKLCGAEALIRWNDPRTGLVPPGRFIPILEETGLIYDVGRWALRRAIEDYLRWRKAGLPAVRIAVNVSPLQLRNAGFIAEIRHKIGIHADAPAGLELEITEGVIMEDVRSSIAILKAIRDMGVTVAIDDFGTGFSSLSYLSKLPVDTLKIDRSFVIEMTGAPEGLGLVSTIISLAHSMRMKAVAEGVETEEQARLLRLLKCDEMQGFLFSGPVPADAFEARFLAAPVKTLPG